MDFNFDENELLKQQEDAQNQKALLGVAGTALQNLQNVPSSYEMLYGKKSERPDIQGMFKAAADSVQDPLDKKKKAMEGFLLSRQGKQAVEQDQALADKKDPNSKATMAARAFMLKQGVDPQIVNSMSAYDIEKSYGDPAELNKIKMKSMIDFENAKKMKGYETGLDIQKAQALANIKPAEKLSAGSVEGLSKADDALQDVLNFKESAKSMSDFSPVGVLNPARYTRMSETGQRIDTYKNQAKAMMQKIGTFMEGGKLTDADFETKYLPMAPQYDDPPELKQQKMAILERMIKQKKNLDLENFKKSGYNVQNYNMADDLPENPLTKAKTQKAPPSGKTRIIQNGFEYIWNPETGKYE